MKIIKIKYHYRNGTTKTEEREYRYFASFVKTMNSFSQRYLNKKAKEFGVPIKKYKWNMINSFWLRPRTSFTINVRVP